MATQNKTQEAQVIEALRSLNGYATLRRLNETIDFSLWKTKTPEASVRRIVQKSSLIFKIRPGLWALEESRQTILKRFKLETKDQANEERFSHSYYQGLLIEIGKLNKQKTYIPAQDKNKLFLEQRLGDLSDTTELPPFSYDNLLRKARTIDVVWFNERQMPSCFYEVEHTTDIKNSLSKFYELQDFHAKFFIVSDESRRREYEDKLNVSMFSQIHNRVEFLNYDQVVNTYTNLERIKSFAWDFL
ncbi:hypothetical protein [Porphyromonas endodontalis]|uniref:hypothetical protein n=1 Tax=Porphyromonas endodontalis TaxID=28124 RepID=UPI0023F50951|nr:hypothetical protein [Porphyromonas endodontalis]